MELGGRDLVDSINSMDQQEAEEEQQPEVSILESSVRRGRESDERSISPKLSLGRRQASKKGEDVKSKQDKRKRNSSFTKQLDAVSVNHDQDDACMIFF